MVVLVGVAGENAVNAGADHLQNRMLDEIGVAGIVEDSGESVRQAELFIELAERE